MAKIVDVPVPDIGDFDTVTVLEVLVAPGQTIAADSSIVTLESDKASMEVPSPQAGVVRELKVAPGDKIGQGALILTLEVADAEAPGAPAPAPAPPAETPPPEAPPPAAVAEPASAPPSPVAQAAPVDEAAFTLAHASPAVRRTARELGVDLGKVEGTGRKGRVLTEDVQAYVKAALAAPRASSGFSLPEAPAIDFSKFGEIEIHPLSRIRKLSATNLSRAWVSIPHVTQFEEADVTEMEAFRQAQQEEAKAKGLKLTPLAFLLLAAARALREFPDFNASLEPGGENLIRKKYVHVGVAVDTPNGLVVPVLRDVDKKGLYQLAAELALVSGRAREGKLTPKDLQGGSFTISSLGGIGGTAFTPIVNAPEVAILGVSRSTTKPVWKDGAFVPRLMLPLSLSYDHRVIDGAAGARFIVYLAGLLADVRRLLL